MAACGIEHIFEKPLSETAAFREALSPWKHIKSMKPIDDHSFTEIFGELHFKENHHHSPPAAGEIPAADQEREKAICCPCRERNSQNRRNESLSSDSLSLCTERLGVESFDDVEKMVSHDLCTDKEWRKHQDGERNIPRNPKAENHRSEAARRSREGFPPPISCIGRIGKPWVRFKSYREDGRFILKEFRIPTQEFLHACRQDGRLKLQFMLSDDDDDLLREDDEQQQQQQQQQESFAE